MIDFFPAILTQRLSSKKKKKTHSTTKITQRSVFQADKKLSKPSLPILGVTAGRQWPFTFPSFFFQHNTFSEFWIQGKKTIAAS